MDLVEGNTLRKLDRIERDSLYWLLLDNGMSEITEGSTRNPLLVFLKQLSQDVFIMLESYKSFNLQSLSNLAVLMQSVVFDNIQGPEEDGFPKMLRRHWYRFYKAEVAQTLSRLRDEDMEDNKWQPRWFGRLSVSYAYLVDSHEFTYRDLWVEDGSRMILPIEEKLFERSHIFFCVEKDSLFTDFEIAAKAMGAHCLYSGKGKSSKAAIEKVLREHFEWSEDLDSPFSEERPIYVIHVSDWDYDGEAVIGQTFGTQLLRYTPHVREARIGVNPNQIENNITNSWYQIKISNSKYREWADENAGFVARCSNCDTYYTVFGSDEKTCPECQTLLEIDTKRAFGFEVEALTTRNYYRAAVSALLRIMPFDELVENLRDHCTADSFLGAYTLFRHIARQNTSYIELEDQMRIIQEHLTEFEEEVIADFERKGEPHIHDWRHLEDDPEPEDFSDYVVSADTFTTAWRPFNRNRRTRELVSFLRDAFSEDYQNYIDKDLREESDIG